jgi:serine/threonine-protein kinase
MEGTTRPIERIRLDDGTPIRIGGYRLYERLGKGGQACVYRARRIGDPDARDVALKRLHPHLIDDDASIQAFSREARLAHLLDHPVIRRIHALCREPDELFLIMECVEGRALTSVIRGAGAAPRALPLRGVLAVLARLCDALHHAHELLDEHGVPAGFVHRDISPSNLIVTPAGRLKLIDLGVARTQTAELGTDSGLIKGKFGYMAPEVLRRGPIDRRADVYSVGVVAWELLTRCKLFPVRNPPIDLEEVRARPIDAPSRRGAECPAELDAVVLRALAIDPADRWATCGAMAAALRGIAGRLGAALDEGAIAELAVALDEPPRPRLARGTPAQLPAAPPPAAPAVAGERRRALALAVAGVCLAVIVIASGGDAAMFATADSEAGAPAATVVAPPDAGAPEARREEVAAAPPGLEVDASAVMRLDGPWPRSRSGAAAYRARLCIDAEGQVLSVELLDGPARLEERIRRTLLRWRYRPYHDGERARPVCFAIESHVQKIPRRR